MQFVCHPVFQTSYVTAYIFFFITGVYLSCTGFLILNPSLENFQCNYNIFTFFSEGLQADHTVHMVRGSSLTIAAPSPASAHTANNNPTPAITRGVDSNDGGVAGLGASLFPGFEANALGGGGAPGLFGAGLPELEQVQQQLTQNPNMMGEIMNMPAVQNLMNNPELMRGLIMSNPQMRELMNRNPELAHILNDPSILRQTLEVARNPELMREMMRNTDRAMSNIEATPEGFNMLRRLYENVQEPFLNATATEGNGRSDLSSNPFAALLGSQGGTHATDSANNSLTSGPETTTGITPNTNPLPNPWNGTGSMPDPSVLSNIFLTQLQALALFLFDERKNAHACIYLS